MTGETAHRSTAATKEVNGPGIIWHIPRPTRNEETVPEQIEQPTFTPRPVLSFVRRSGRLDARLQRAWDNYADTYLLDINAGEGYDPGVAHTLLLAGKQRLGNLRIAQVNAPELLAATAPGSIAEVWTFFPDPWPKMKHHKRRIVQPQLAQSIHGALADGGAWRIATDIEDYALHVHEVMDGRTDFRNAGTIAVSLPTGHVGKGNAELADDMPHADFTESERFDDRVLTNFEKKGLAAGRVIHDLTYIAV